MEVLGHSEAKIQLANNEIVVSNLNPGTYSLRIESVPDANHNADVKIISVTVNKASARIQVSKGTFQLKRGTWKIRVVDSENRPVGNMKVTLKVYTGSKFKKVDVVTNAKGEASYSVKGLSKGKHKVVLSISHKGYSAKSATSSIKIIKPKALKFKLKQKVDDNDGSLRSFMVLNKKTKKGVNGIKVKVLIYTGKKYKTYTFKTKKIKGKKVTYNGAFGFATNKFSVGKHKVKIMPASIKYKGLAKTTIKITKKARKGPKFMREV
jgi:hypothetical protein